MTLTMREMAHEHGLTDAEYDRALEVLGREPTFTELGVLSVMWSEHCSYKSSRIHLGKFPTEGPQVVQGPGENAGAVDIGAGLAAVFKMESHNHPSFIEPYQGAATGVGGILRDVFTMGARPVGSMNSLRFGSVDHEKTPHLFHGVVSGIAGYGNCVGVPTVGGEVYFDPAYNGNILVNVFTVGVAPKDGIFKGVASGVGNPVFYVGAGTGRDGIHGATMASEQFEEGSEEKRPTVQVGDPFREKLLIEACLELMETGAIVGIQDMGAAGLTSSSVEMADRGGVGIRIDIDTVPKRELEMSAYEVLLSESQERMLIVLREGREDDVARVFDRWELEWSQIGEVTDTGSLEIDHNGERVADIPVALLTSEAPVYDRPTRRPAYLDSLECPDFGPPEDLGDALIAMMGRENICSREPIFDQFDHMVGLGTVVLPGRGDAAVLRIPGEDAALAISVDCNSRYCYLDPRRGAQLAVAEATRNVACTGATPLGITDCLNFGDPTDPEIMWQFVEAVEGMSAACIALNTPVVSGNVSLYNSSFGQAIYPTPTVAAVGAFFGALTGDRAKNFVERGFRHADRLVYLIGETRPDEIGGSEYLMMRTESVGDQPPSLDLKFEARLQKGIVSLIVQGLVESAHDCSEGGLGVALSECLLDASGLGLELRVEAEDRDDRWLFAESASRIVVSVRRSDKARFEALCADVGLPVQALGTTTDTGRFEWPGHLSVSVEALRTRYKGGLSVLER